MYESYYGFTERPFQLTHNSNWFFASRLHKKALAYLQYGLTQGEGFIVITGDVGTGKTTLASQLLSMLNQDEIVARQIVTSKLQPDDLIRMIASSFNLKVEENNKASYLDAIYIFLKRLHSQHRRALLLVDEAQNLPLESIEELRMLSNFQIDGKPLLQSFLLGQNELNPIIQAPNMEQFRQRIIASSNLVPLIEVETKEYIQFRLHMAGLNHPLLEDDCFSLVQTFSRGIPRRINLLMDRVLLLGYLEQHKTISAEHVQSVINEISEEIAHQAPASPQNIKSESEAPAATSPSPAALGSASVQQLLDESLEQKLKLIKELDELILQRQQQAK
ncbi:MAG: AAA family ATPase [Paraglaciecola sp.]|uniref:AAA family ATPase n=1 Tax=Alishewanella maricola TaxID=2795740 RepID=A0ABS8C343_9ALTE|nr:AAA family ATPase [Alishewanella maricola]MCB5226735.1 AAA family ATPase [Alishewanella maricola]MDP5129808.1 AAA family ATPase [Paraglaciecola sp.]